MPICYLWKPLSVWIVKRVGGKIYSSNVCGGQCIEMGVDRYVVWLIPFVIFMWWCFFEVGLWVNFFSSDCYVWNMFFYHESVINLIILLVKSLKAVVQKKPRQHVHGLVVVSYRSRGYQICKGTPGTFVSINISLWYHK